MVTIEEQRSKGIFISRADLWEKLIERRLHNINALGEVAYHVNMGINQAIGIMNSMQGFTYDPKEMEDTNGKRSTTQGSKEVQGESQTADD